VARALDGKLRAMSVKRMDHVSVVVEDLPAAIGYFEALGLEVEGQGPVEGTWVDRVNGIDGVKVDIVMMHTPDGHSKLELTYFRSPALIETRPQVFPPNALGLRSIMFAVDDVDATVAKLRAHGGELMGEIVDYQGIYRLCYTRGPGGIIVSLAQEL
jgi:catechol 2,3-dioxygenase-like lactoylglutathione lyase family enzyme